MPANGTRGILIRSMDGRTLMRVYTEDRTSFVDYELLHSDLSVIIDDEDAHFYQKKGEMYLDHSPETLWPGDGPIYESGQKVMYIPDGKIYDFGYIGSTGKAIIYEQGERNMQDSCAVDLNKLKPVNVIG